MPYYRKTITCGEYVEVVEFHGKRIGEKVRRDPKIRCSDEGQEGKNQQRAEKRIVQLINANFGLNDLFLTLTHDEPVDEAGAQKAITAYLRRVKAYRKKHGLPEVKYIRMQEKQGKWHHHLIITGMPMEVAIDLWGHGRVTLSKLDKINQYKDLAKYLLREDKSPKGEPDAPSIKPQRRKHARRWTPSKNLTQPAVEIKEIKRADLNRPPKVPKGCQLLPEWELKCDFRGNMYRTYTYIKPERKKKPPLGGAKKKRRNIHVLQKVP